MYPPGIQFDSQLVPSSVALSPPSQHQGSPTSTEATPRPNSWTLLSKMLLPFWSSPSSLWFLLVFPMALGQPNALPGACRHVVQAALPSLMALCLPALLDA